MTHLSSTSSDGPLVETRNFEKAQANAPMRRLGRRHRSAAVADIQTRTGGQRTGAGSTGILGSQSSESYSIRSTPSLFGCMMGNKNSAGPNGSLDSHCLIGNPSANRTAPGFRQRRPPINRASRAHRYNARVSPKLLGRQVAYPRNPYILRGDKKWGGIVGGFFPKSSPETVIKNAGCRSFVLSFLHCFLENQNVDG